jgi:hypothetical protein
MRNMGIERPVQRKFFPSWNLALVLRSLLDRPYEPLGEASLALLTRKTLFLVALASGRRRSELQALSADPALIQFSIDRSSVSLLPRLGFLAKTQRPDVLPDPIVIPALQPLVGPEPDRLLCPVRALCYYLRATEDPEIRRGRSELFIPYRSSLRTASPAVISSWLCAVISDAYDRNYDGDIPPDFHATAHDIRALSASWAAINRVPMEEILLAATWKHHTTFTEHYLREMCTQRDELFALGPIVVSQKVVGRL